MEVNAVAELIDNLGFPIVVCGVLFWFLRDLMKNNQRMMLEIKTSVENNTKTIEILHKEVMKK